MVYQYKMIQIPPSVTVERAERGTEAASYLQRIANEQAKNGWDFYRVDEIGVEVKPGCLAALFGGKASYTQYYVITFRKEAQSGSGVSSVKKGNEVGD